MNPMRSGGRTGLVVRFSQLAAGVLVLTAAASAHAAVITTFYGTGVDGAGALLAAGAVDTHYSVAPGSGPFAIGAGGLAASWVANTASSQWISASADTLAGGGPFVYSISFSLAGLEAASAVLNLDVAADNQVAVLLNGNAAGMVSFPGWTAFTALSISSGFVAGNNTLSFVIPNNDVTADDGPTGLQVRVVSATANAIPEPSSWALAGLGLVLAGAARRKR